MIEQTFIVTAMINELPILLYFDSEIVEISEDLTGNYWPEAIAYSIKHNGLRQANLWDAYDKCSHDVSIHYRKKL